MYEDHSFLSTIVLSSLVTLLGVLAASPTLAGGVELGYSPSILYQNEKDLAAFGGVMHGLKAEWNLQTRDGLCARLSGQYNKGNHDFEFKEPAGGTEIEVQAENELTEGEGVVGMRRFSNKNSAVLYTGYGYAALANTVTSLQYSAPIIGTITATNLDAERTLTYHYIPIGFAKPFWSEGQYPGRWTLQYNRIINAERQEGLATLPGIMNNTRATDARGHALEAKIRFNNSNVEGMDVGTIFSVYAHYQTVEAFDGQTVRIDTNQDGVQDDSIDRNYPKTELFSAGLVMAVRF